VLSQARPEIILRLADFILKHTGPILQEWDTFARTVEPVASDMTVKELRNHAAEMLKYIANDLLTIQSRQGNRKVVWQRAQNLADRSR
jgi:hypothetical protein